MQLLPLAYIMDARSQSWQVCPNTTLNGTQQKGVCVCVLWYLKSMKYDHLPIQVNKCYALVGLFLECPCTCTCVLPRKCNLDHFTLRRGAYHATRLILSPCPRHGDTVIGIPPWIRIVHQEMVIDPVSVIITATIQMKHANFWKFFDELIARVEPLFRQCHIPPIW